jgi:hypothetical protein
MHRSSLYLQHHARPQLEKAAITFTRYLVSNGQRSHRHVPRVAGAEPTGMAFEVSRKRENLSHECQNEWKYPDGEIIESGVCEK